MFTVLFHNIFCSHPIKESSLTVRAKLMAQTELSDVPG